MHNSRYFLRPLDSRKKKAPTTWKKKTGDTCAVCLEQLLPTANFTRLGCGHAFHASCFTEWVVKSGTSKCPICRRDVCGHPQRNDVRLPMDFSSPYMANGIASIGRQLNVNAVGEDYEAFLRSNWSYLHSAVSICGQSETESWENWKRILRYHKAFVELAYELPEEIPSADDDGEIEEFISNFRNVIIRGLGSELKMNTWKPPAELLWLLSIFGTSQREVTGVNLGSRLTLLVHGMACNITVMESVDVSVRTWPYSFICSGAVRKITIKRE